MDKTTWEHGALKTYETMCMQMHASMHITHSVMPAIHSSNIDAASTHRDCFKTGTVSHTGLQQQLRIETYLHCSQKSAAQILHLLFHLHSHGLESQVKTASTAIIMRY